MIIYILDFEHVVFQNNYMVYSALKEQNDELYAPLKTFDFFQLFVLLTIVLMWWRFHAILVFSSSCFPVPSLSLSVLLLTISINGCENPVDKLIL